MTRRRGPRRALPFKSDSASSSDPTVRRVRKPRQRRPKRVTEKTLATPSSRKPQNTRIRAASLRIQNPYPWMPLPEALVKIELDALNVSYSHRYFDPKWSPLLAAAFGDQPYEPEFTLPYDKVVISIQRSDFGGQIAPLINRVALADVILKSEGWKFVIWWDVDIKRGLMALFQRDLPNILAGKGHSKYGTPIVPPYGEPDYLAKLRWALHHGKKNLIRATHTGTGEKIGRRTYRRRKRRARH